MLKHIALSTSVYFRNCLFRALGDQFEGHVRNHYRHRQDVVKYIVEHRTEFEPFISDDTTFEKHGKKTNVV